MRAPPESFNPTTGTPTLIACSIILTIFRACAADRDPPKTVKSWLNTKTFFPSTVPWPVITPSPGTFCSAMPNSLQSCSTNMSHSSNEPASRNTSIRSRAVNLPFACCESMRRCPPPSRAWARLSSSVWMISSIFWLLPQPVFGDDITALIPAQQLALQTALIALQQI